LVDLSKLKIRESFILKTEQLGDLRVRVLNPSDLRKLAYKYDYLKKSDPIQVIRFILTIIAYLTIKGEQGISRDDSNISLEDSKKVSITELDVFSDNVIKYHSDFLFNKFRASGKKIVFEKIIPPREEEETSIDYLSRIVLELIREQIAIDKDLLVKAGAGLFGDSLHKDIINAVESQRKLYESMLPFSQEIDLIKKYSNLLQEDSYFPKSFVPVEPIRIERPINHIIETNERLDVLIDYQSKMGPVLQDSSNLLGDMNKLWIGIAADSKKDSRKIIRLTILIIIISLVGFSGVFFSYLNYKSSV